MWATVGIVTAAVGIVTGGAVWATVGPHRHSCRGFISVAAQPRAPSFQRILPCRAEIKQIGLKYVPGRRAAQLRCVSVRVGMRTVRRRNIACCAAHYNDSNILCAQQQ